MLVLCAESLLYLRCWYKAEALILVVTVILESTKTGKHKTTNMSRNQITLLHCVSSLLFAVVSVNSTSPLVGVHPLGVTGIFHSNFHRQIWNFFVIFL